MCKFSFVYTTAAPGGDGQTGDAGEGKAGTDRHNILQMNKADENWPVPFESAQSNMFESMLYL